MAVEHTPVWLRSKSGDTSALSCGSADVVPPAPDSRHFRRRFAYIVFFLHTGFCHKEMNSTASQSPKPNFERLPPQRASHSGQFVSRVRNGHYGPKTRARLLGDRSEAECGDGQETVPCLNSFEQMGATAGIINLLSLKRRKQGLQRTQHALQRTVFLALSLRRTRAEHISPSWSHQVGLSIGVSRRSREAKGKSRTEASGTHTFGKEDTVAGGEGEQVLVVGEAERGNKRPGVKWKQRPRENGLATRALVATARRLGTTTARRSVNRRYGGLRSVISAGTTPPRARPPGARGTGRVPAAVLLEAPGGAATSARDGSGGGVTSCPSSRSPATGRSG